MDVKAIVENLNNNLIETIMITGDNVFTSIKVALDLSFYKYRKIIIVDSQ